MTVRADVGSPLNAFCNRVGCVSLCGAHYSPLREMLHIGEVVAIDVGTRLKWTQNLDRKGVEESSKLNVKRSGVLGDR